MKREDDAVVVGVGMKRRNDSQLAVDICCCNIVCNSNFLP